MNKPAVFFAGTTAMFALSTLYFAMQSGERAGESVAVRVDDGAASLDAAQPADSGPALAPVATPATASTAGQIPATTSAASASSAAVDSRRDVMLPFARDFLRQYDDLTQRDMLVNSARKSLESQYAGLRDRLKLDPATFDRLVSLLAEESLEQQATYFRCLTDPACDSTKTPWTRGRGDELLALLGPEGHSEFTRYRDAIPEWQSVVQLRGRLSESNYLRDGDAERLRTALTEARERHAEETRLQGGNLSGWGNGTGMLWYTADGTPQQQLASATQFSHAQRQRAAALLNAEQLRVFAQLQDEMLAGFAAYLQQAQAKPEEPRRPNKAGRSTRAAI
jgi:hypothetical protein